MKSSVFIQEFVEHQEHKWCIRLTEAFYPERRALQLKDTVILQRRPFSVCAAEICGEYYYSTHHFAYESGNNLDFMNALVEPWPKGINIQYLKDKGFLAPNVSQLFSNCNINEINLKKHQWR